MNDVILNEALEEGVVKDLKRFFGPSIQLSLKSVWMKLESSLLGRASE